MTGDIIVDVEGFAIEVVMDDDTDDNDNDDDVISVVLFTFALLTLHCDPRHDKTLSVNPLTLNRDEPN